MKTISAREANQKFSKLLSDAAGGEEVVITKRGRPVVKMAAGPTVSGCIRLSVDPFFYREEFHALSGMPALIYTWRIQEILIQAAPLVKVGSREFRRDRSQWGWRPIAETDARRDDDGVAEYLLRCQRVDIPPTHKAGP